MVKIYLFYWNCLFNIYTYIHIIYIYIYSYAVLRKFNININLSILYLLSAPAETVVYDILEIVHFRIVPS